MINEVPHYYIILRDLSKLMVNDRNALDWKTFKSSFVR